MDFKYLGIATFPWDYSRNASVDGIRVHYGSLPGGDIANYNLGETATHEAGHWFGLYHTFQGGCTATNDEVADTPAQARSDQRLPRGRGHLPAARALDPIHNYMDYSYDSCYTAVHRGPDHPHAADVLGLPGLRTRPLATTGRRRPGTSRAPRRTRSGAPLRPVSASTAQRRWSPTVSATSAAYVDAQRSSRSAAAAATPLAVASTGVS